MTVINKKLCECGCGGTTKRRFCPGHQNRNKKRKEYIIKNGYCYMVMPEHPHADNNGYIKRATVVVEDALGKILPKGTIIHHVDENKLNDNKSNLIPCENDSYHKLLHDRRRTFLACGNVKDNYCYICQSWDKKENMIRRGNSYVHHKCSKQEGRLYYENNKLAYETYYNKNKEVILGKRKIHYENNKEKIMEQHKDYLKRKRNG